MTSSGPIRPEQPSPTGRRRVLGDRLERDPDIGRFLAGIEAWVPATAPEPSAELLAALAALRDSAAEPPAGQFPAVAQFEGHRRRAAHRLGYRRTVLAGALTVAIAIPATGVAAANDSLPRPAERMVSRMVNDLTPFTIDPTLDLPTPAGSVHPPVPRSGTAGPARPSPAVGGSSGPAVGGSGGSVPAAAAGSPPAGWAGEPEETTIAVRPSASAESIPEDGLSPAGPRAEPDPASAEPSSSGAPAD